MTVNGFHDRQLTIDLSTGEVSEQNIGIDVLRNFAGGRGLGIKLLWDMMPEGTDPLAPENPLILATGPYTGAGVFSAFFNVTTKSPLTGLAAGSHCGGFRGPAFKRTGYDCMSVTDTSDKPVYILVEELSRSGGKQAMETGKAFGEYGSSMAFNFFNEAHTLPTRNFRAGYFEQAG